MKNKFLIAEYIIAVLFLSLPPITAIFSVQNAETENSISISSIFQTLTFLLIAIMMEIQYRKLSKAEEKKDSSVNNLIYKIARGTLSFGFLMLVQALISLAAMLIKNFTGVSIAKTFSFTCKGPLQWIWTIFSFLAMAFYEEEFYRQFLPDLLSFVQPLKKGLNLFLEAIAIVLFALAHAYQGLAAVFNALFCALILRSCRKKTGSIWTGFIIHALYNIVIFLFALAL